MTVRGDRRVRTSRPRPWSWWAVRCSIALTLVSGSAGFSACASPTTPTSTIPATIATLTVSGNSLLSGVGQTSQLTAATSAGAVVTSSLSWQTASPSVATVSASGLVTATGPGTTTITATATAPAAKGVVTMFVAQPGNPTTTITACQTIQKSGPYVLGSDLPQNGGSPCLQVVTVAAVQLDCRGHAVSGLLLNTVNTVTVSNCTVSGTVTMTNVANVTVTNCTLANGVNVTTGSSVVVQNSTISAPANPVSVTNGRSVALVQDTITSAFGAAAVQFLNGTGDQVVQATITGGYDGGSAEVGTDDGILLTNENGDTITGNSVSGFFDTAVEGVAFVGNVTVASNTFSNIGTAAIGAYYCTNWTGNVIRGNQVSLAPTLVLVNDQGGAFCTTPPPVFSGNQFIGNQFRNPIAGVGGPSGPGPRMVVIFLPGTAASNLLENNDFGTNDGPRLVPLSAFTDGGGNICGPQNPALSNFVCTGGAPAARVPRDAPVILRRPPHAPRP
jgi:Bacterial Ig-like domain (group 2)